MKVWMSIHRRTSVYAERLIVASVSSDVPANFPSFAGTRCATH